MKILSRLPIASEHSLSDVHRRPVNLRPNQIIIKVSVLPDEDWDPRAPILPAILDTGNNLNFSTQATHLIRWAGTHPQSLRACGRVREGARSPLLHAATVWIHRNVPGRGDLRNEPPFRLQLPEGIAIYPTDESDYPRLPLLGLRAILKKNLKLTIDGRRKHASLRTPLW